MSKINQSLGIGVIGGLVAGGASAIATWGGRKTSFCPNIPYNSSIISGVSFGVSAGAAFFFSSDNEDEEAKALAIFVLGGAALTTAGNKFLHGKNISYGTCLGLSTISALPLIAAIEIGTWMMDS